MPKRKASKESKEDRWRRKMKKYEGKLGRKTSRILYSSDEESDQGLPDLCESRLAVSDDLRIADVASLPAPAQHSAAPDSAAPDIAAPDTAAADVASPVLVTEPENDADLVCTDQEIDPALLMALGDFIPEASEWGEDINDNLAKRWEPILKDGLKKEVREEILKKYLLPNNCRLAKPPILNPEVAAVLSESSRNRDARIHKKQSQLGCALSVVAKVLSGMLRKTIETPEALRLPSDASKLIADSHYAETETRRALVTPLLEKSFIESFKDRKRDSHLFGEKLGEFIKSSRGIKKTGQLIQAASASHQNLNWRGPPPRHQQRGSRVTASRGGGTRALQHAPAPPAPRRRPQAPAPAPARQAPSQAAPARRTFAQRAPRR